MDKKQQKKEMIFLKQEVKRVPNFGIKKGPKKMKVNGKDYLINLVLEMKNK